MENRWTLTRILSIPTYALGRASTARSEDHGDARDEGMEGKEGKEERSGMVSSGGQIKPLRGGKGGESDGLVWFLMSLLWSSRFSRC